MSKPRGLRWWAAGLAQVAYQYLHPFERRPVHAANAHAVLTEAERAIASCPAQATFAWRSKAQALQALGRSPEAAAARARGTAAAQRR